jgi:CheY-like chemotaxis protein
MTGRPPTDSPLAGVHCVVVDPDAPSAKLCALLLSGAGAVVRTVGAGAPVFPLLAEASADVVVLELVLRDVDGLDVARALAALPRPPVVVAVTARNGPRALRAALDAGCAALVHKPLDTETFATTVARLLPGEP